MSPHARKTAESTPQRDGGRSSRSSTEHLWLNVLLLSIPVAIGLHLADAPPLAVFIASGLGIIPLAGVMGEATEALASHTGPDHRRHPECDLR